jgi:hypothetical protein
MSEVPLWRTWAKMVVAILVPTIETNIATSIRNRGTSLIRNAPLLT